MASAVQGPSVQFWKKQPATRSPAANSVTPSPTASTSPAPSELGMRGSAMPRAAGSLTTERSRSEEHTSELQSLMRISYAVFCLKKKNIKQTKYSTKIKY